VELFLAIGVNNMPPTIHGHHRTNHLIDFQIAIVKPKDGMPFEQNDN
jgi:hypothetical protein